MKEFRTTFEDSDHKKLLVKKKEGKFKSWRAAILHWAGVE